MFSRLFNCSLFIFLKCKLGIWNLPWRSAERDLETTPWRMSFEVKYPRCKSYSELQSTEVTKHIKTQKYRQQCEQSQVKRFHQKASTRAWARNPGPSLHGPITKGKPCNKYSYTTGFAEIRSKHRCNRLSGRDCGHPENKCYATFDIWPPDVYFGNASTISTRSWVCRVYHVGMGQNLWNYQMTGE